MFASCHQIRNATSSSASGSAHAVDQGYHLSEHRREDVTGGIQEVTSVEGSVPSLSLEVVDFRQEGVDGIGLPKTTEQVGSAGDEVLELSEDLSVDHDITSLDWLVHVETCEDLIIFTEEGVGLSRDLRRRDVAREVFQPLDPGGKDVDVFVQSMGPETVEYLGAEGVKVDGISLVHFETYGGPEIIEVIDDFGTEDIPLIGRQSKVKINVEVEIQVRTDVIGEVQREIPPRSNSVELGPTTR